MKQKQPLPQRNLQHQGRKPCTAAVVALFLHGILLVSSRELRPEILPSALKISDSEILHQSNQTQGRRYRDKRSFDGDKSENQSLLRRGKSPHLNKGNKTSRSSPTNISYNGERIEVSPISSNVHLYPEPKKSRKTTDDDTIIISAPVESSHYLPAGMEKSFSPSDTPRLNNPGDDQFEVLKTKTLLREESPDALLQQTRKACVLVQLSLKLDTNPEDTSWLITLGDRDVLESGDAIIVAESRGQYGSTGKETISICLPGNGQYTFTVFNWTGNGNGDYSLLSDGRTVFKGRKYGWIRTNTFVLPLPELPSDSPSQSSLPTTSPVPTMDCTFIDISITFDSSPDETSWLVFEGNYNTLESGDANIIQKSPDYDRNQYAYTTETYRVCLPNEGQFSFAIFDKFGNGICCGGGYTVTSPDSPDTIAQGGEFGSIEVKTFFLPFGSTPITPPPQSAPPTSPAPTTTCFKIEISFLFDSFPSETKWSLSEIDSNPFITGGPFDDWSYAGVFTQQSLCLPEGVYEFIVSDLSGDGICCSYGDGTYSIIYTAEGANDIIAEGGSFGYSDNVIFSLPYEPKSPTVSPAPTSSLLPTSECYMVEVSLKFGQNPSESMWVVVEGDAGGIQNDDWIPVVVMESPSSYYDTLPSFTVDFQTFCLSEGEFTFFIVDDAGDGMGPEGSYTLALIQDDGSKTIIAQGGSFLTLESTTFVIPFVPQPLDVDSQPTPSPSSPSGRETLQPTPLASNLVPSTTAPSNTCIWMQVTLEFAVFPYYIRWYLFAGDFDDLESNKQNLIAQSPSYDGIERYATMVHDLCLPNENAIYSFAIFDDSNYDYGRGVAKYILSHGKAEETFAFGGEFNYFELVTFEVPFLPVPTSMPSISLQPSPPNAPPADCSIMLEIIIQPDGFPEEIRWEVAAGGSSSTEDPSAIIIAQSPPGEVSSETYKVCLPWEGLYTFTIFDSAGDGLCCTGSYELFLNGQTIGSGMTFGYIESTQFSFPYIRPPSPPTMTPTITQQPSISPKPSIKLDCIEITVNSDESVSWDIAIGSESSFTSNAELVATSPFYSGFNETETHLICLEDGKYTFTIYGGSAYTIIFKDDADTLIAEVYDIYGVESTTFNIPYFAPPTASPTISSQPSYSHNPTNECIQLDIELQFDTFPDESSWMVIAGSFNEDGSYDGDRLIAQSPFYDPTNYTDAKEQISFCLPGEGVYSFAMRDSSYDGMCCSFGNGGFVISTQGTTIAQGGQFQEYDIITFNIPFLPMPSLSPSTSTKPSYSLSPTEDCSRIVVSILFDAYPSEVLWNFVESNGEIGENIVAESPLYDNSKADSIVTETICLKDGLYVFTISDGAGDGICCGNFGEGKYEVLLLGGTNQTLAEGGDYGYFESTTFLLPYTVLPTSMPSVSPQPTNSISPTSSCVWIEVIINFDANPFDTLWDIAIGSYSSYDVDDAVSVADSPIYSMEAAFDTARHPVCLPGKGRYTFGIMKSGGFQGSGGYILVTVTDGGNRAVIAQGGGFEWTDSVTFDIPLHISPRF